MTEKQLKTKISNKINYEYYKKIGICVRCKKNKAANGKVQCQDCLDDRSEYLFNRYNEGKLNSNKKRNSEYIKRKKQLCDAFGICTTCMKHEKYKGKKCMECYIKATKLRKNKSSIDKLPKELWDEFDKCMVCGEDREEGHKLCMKHLEIARNNAANARSFINREEHIWKKQINLSLIKKQSLSQKSKAI